MKMIRCITLWILPAALSFFSSCSKKSSSAPACQIISLTANDNSYGYFFTYDSKGRATSIQTKNGNGVQLLDLSYTGNAVLISSATSSYPASDSIVLNSNGDVNYVLENSNGVPTITNYSYSSPGVISQISTSINNGAPTVVNYYYSNGDLDSASDGEKFTYYEDQPYRIGDYLALTFMIQYGNKVPIFKHAHMLKSLSTNGSSTTVSYTYDNTGKVTSLAAVGNSGGAAINIDYDCGQ